MKVYCGTYKKYNEGNLFGEWLDLDDYSTKEEFLKACEELHKDEPDPELMFQDWEGPDSLIGESYVNEKVWEVLRLNDYEQEAIIAYFDNVDDEREISDILEDYQGYHDSFLDFAHQIIDDYYDLERMMGNLASYFDYEAFARDLKMDYTVLDGESGGVHVFTS